MSVKIIVNEVLSSDLAVATESGDTVFKQIENALNQGEKIILDFINIRIMTTAFLNAAIGQLYSNDKFNSEFLNSHLNIINVADEDKPLFTIVIKRAREFFNDKRNFENSIDNNL